jgi:hypothetical protein
MLTCFTFRPNVISSRSPVGTLVGSEDGMPDYRAYLMGTDGHIFRSVAMIYADDAEAIEHAQQLAVGHDVELWQLDRKVAVFPDQNKTP